MAEKCLEPRYLPKVTNFKAGSDELILVMVIYTKDKSLAVPLPSAITVQYIQCILKAKLRFCNLLNQSIISKTNNIQLSALLTMLVLWKLAKGNEPYRIVQIQYTGRERRGCWLAVAGWLLVKGVTISIATSENNLRPHLPAVHHKTSRIARILQKYFTSATILITSKDCC